MVEKEFSFYDLFVPLTNKKIVVFLLLIGLLIFGNSFFNPFIFDDIPQIVQNTAVHTLYSIPSFFTTSISLPHTSLPLLHLYYKPLLFSSYDILWTLFQGNAFGFHGIQTLLHITNSILVFFLLTKFFKKPLSFFLSLLFLLHPIQSESVIYAANLQDVLFVFFGLLGLHIFSQTKHKMKTLYTICLTLLFLLFSLLSKETGILFLFIFILYYMFFQRIKIKQSIIVVCITSCIYIFLRFIGSFSSTDTLTLSLMQKLSLSERVMSIPKIIWYYISTFLLPINLATGQAWIIRQINFSDFWLPLIYDLVVFFVIFLLGFTIYKYYQKLFSAFLFFTMWFLVGLLFHIQLIPLDLTVADRWFYFPIIGLLGIAGIVIQLLFSKISKQQQNIVVFCWIIILCVFGILTMIRNAQWQNPFTLYSHDIVYAQDNPTFLSYYAGLLMEHSEYNKAKPYLDKSIKFDPSLGSNSINLGAWEEHADNFETAQQIYDTMISNPEISSSFKQLGYENLARVLLFKLHAVSHAKHVTKKGLQYYPHDQLLTEYLAMIIFDEGNKDNAEMLLQNSLKTLPNQQMVSLLEAMQNNTFQLSN